MQMRGNVKDNFVIPLILCNKKKLIILAASKETIQDNKEMTWIQNFKMYVMLFFTINVLLAYENLCEYNVKGIKLVLFVKNGHASID
ncbi:hypothetical protein CR513_26478, partial [Mucuna pruriens]